MNKIDVPGIIKNNHIEYDYDITNSIDRFKTENNGKCIVMSLQVQDGIEYFQHKYYRGYLLPSLAVCGGEAHDERNIDETELAKVHVWMKRDYLYVPETDINKIPRKYFKRGYTIIPKHNLDNLEPGLFPFNFITGVIIVSNNDDVIGYIKSTADMNFSEMKEYILNCEKRLFVDMGGYILERLQKQANTYRKMAFDDGMFHNAS